MFTLPKRQMATSKTESKAQKILNRLREELPSSKMKGVLDPFKTLIMTVISQNTNDRNMERAYQNLSKRFKIDPETLSNADVNSIEDCLKVAGLYRGKARVIKTVSSIILEDYNGSIDFIFQCSFPVLFLCNVINCLQFNGKGGLHENKTWDNSVNDDTILVSRVTLF